MKNAKTFEEMMKALQGKYILPEDKISRELEIAKRMMKRDSRRVTVDEIIYEVARTAFGPILTPYGDLYQVNFTVDDRWKEYKVIVKAGFDEDAVMPKFDSLKPAYLRIDSGCEPGQMFYDMACDCKRQLEIALEH